MAISVDTVYQKVLALANKEQRGYVTPQEFNLFADHAQKEIFEQYFYDINQWGRQHGNSTESDMLDHLEAKISAFELWAVNPNATLANQYGDLSLEQFPDFYKLIEVRVNYDDGTGYHNAEEMTTKEFRKYEISPLTYFENEYPYYIHYFNASLGDRIKIYPNPPQNTYTFPDGTLGDDIRISYIRKPSRPNWGYVIVNDKALYNDNISVDFQLHASEETELVYRILALAGIAIKQPDLIQSAIGLETANVQQQKQ